MGIYLLEGVFHDAVSKNGAVDLVPHDQHVTPTVATLYDNVIIHNLLV
jgi:hypothetical protein